MWVYHSETHLVGFLFLWVAKTHCTCDTVRNTTKPRANIDGSTIIQSSRCPTSSFVPHCSPVSSLGSCILYVKNAHFAYATPCSAIEQQLNKARNLYNTQRDCALLMLDMAYHTRLGVKRDMGLQRHRTKGSIGISC